MTPKQAIAFLKRGKDKGSPRDVVFPYGDGVFTTNGHVIHIWRGEYSGETSDRTPPDVAGVNFGTPNAKIAITKEHLKRALKACRAFKPRSISIEANSSLRLSAETFELGNAEVCIEDGKDWMLGKRQKSTPILYRHIGDDVSFSIDPKYIYNAVMAMDNIIIIEIFDTAIKLYSEEAEAWIMHVRQYNDTP